MRWLLVPLLLLAACTDRHLERSSGADLPHHVDTGWPVLPQGVHLGAVSGVAVDSKDRVYVFHRAGAGFDNDAIIQSPTVFVFEADSGALVDQWGAGLFIVPHGIAVDARDHVWLTDTAANLVFEMTTDGDVIGRYDGT